MTPLWFHPVTTTTYVHVAYSAKVDTCRMLIDESLAQRGGKSMRIRAGVAVDPDSSTRVPAIASEPPT